MKEKRFGKILSTVLSFVLVFALAFSFVSPLTVEAKTKSITLTGLKNRPNWYVDQANKVSKNIKKGTYNCKLVKKGSEGQVLLKFTAPKTKNYTFTISNLNAPGADYVNGFFNIMKPNAGSIVLSSQKVKTNKGSDNGLYFASRKGSRGFIPSRYGKLKINQGETVYIYINSDYYKSKYVKFKLSIK